jgi:hypothetical protein
MADSRQCVRCERERPLSDFSPKRASDTHDGRLRVCDGCLTAIRWIRNPPSSVMAAFTEPTGD